MECPIINPTFNGFEETYSYWSEFSFFSAFHRQNTYDSNIWTHMSFANKVGSIFNGTDQNWPNYRIGPDCALCA